MESGDGHSSVPPSVERLLCDDPDVEFAVVFGSQAAGTAGPASDLDLAVKFDGELSVEERFRQRCHLSGRIQRDDAPFVDVSDLEELPLEVAKAAIDGDFLCGNENAFRAFETRIETEYEERRDDIKQSHRDTISRIARDGLRG